MRLTLLVLCTVALAAQACGAAMPPQAAEPYRPEATGWADAREAPAAGVPLERPMREEAGKDTDKDTIAGDVGREAKAFERKVIYTGWFTVDVYDIKAAQQKIIEFVTAAGGYMQQTNGPAVVLRIPAEKFALVEPELDKLGRVDDSLTSIHAQDVSEEYYDVELRLHAKKKYLDSLYKLLESSGKLEEKLAVQKEIARVVEEIERLEGRLRFLSSQVSLATVTVTFRTAHSGQQRTFRLPWDWLDTLGLEYLVP